MNKRLLNLMLFSTVIIFIVLLPIIFVDRYLPQSQHPWQLQPFNADSLSSFYKSNYQIIGDTSLIDYLKDTSGAIVNILVDGWGIPYDEKKLVQDFELFKNNSHRYAIHKRSFNITAIAESGEFQKGFANGIYVSGADSSSCRKKQLNLSRYFSNISCYDDYEDAKMVSILDTLLTKDSLKRIAWTTLGTRMGNRTNLHLLLEELSKLAKKHPHVQFIIQGTHRPILGTPETRRKYLTPWVPAVFLNGDIRSVE